MTLQILGTSPRMTTVLPSATLEHPSSDLPFGKLRVGHLLPQGEKGRRRACQPAPLRMRLSISSRAAAVVRSDSETLPSSLSVRPTTSPLR